jgi:hypothetical protein
MNAACPQAPGPEAKMMTGGTMAKKPSKPPSLDPLAYFTLGIGVATHILGVRQPRKGLSKIIKTVKDIAEGDLTLLDTPEEMLPGLPRKYQPTLADAVRNARRRERAAAKHISRLLEPL